MISSPRHSGTATIDRIWPPMIDSDVASSSCALAVSTAARSSSTRRSTARLARTGSRRRGRGRAALRPARSRDTATVKRSLSLSERSRIATWVARGSSSKVASTTPRASRSARAGRRAAAAPCRCGARRPGRPRPVGDLRQVDDRARRDQPIAEVVVVGLVADPHRDRAPDRCGSPSSRQSPSSSAISQRPAASTGMRSPSRSTAEPLVERRSRKM